MRKIMFTGMILATMIFMSSCKSVEKAVEDTFATQPGKFNAEEELKNRSFFEKVKDIFIDESNERIFKSDIVSDAEDKMGFKFSTTFSRNMEQYLNEHEIERYLSEEEIKKIASQLNDDNLLLNHEKLNQIRENLYQVLGREDLYVHKGDIYIYPTYLFIKLVNPENPNHVDSYMYLNENEWKITPEKIGPEVAPMTQAIPLADIPFETIDKVIQSGIEILKEMGDYREFDTMNHEIGITYIYTRLNQGELVFGTILQGSREGYYLTFDAEGTLLQKERF